MNVTGAPPSGHSSVKQECPALKPSSAPYLRALERFPFLWNRKRALDSCICRIFYGEPLHTSPENALTCALYSECSASFCEGDSRMKSSSTLAINI